MWLVLKLDYTTADSPEIKTQISGYRSLDEAQHIFDHLELGYQLSATVRVKGNKQIMITAIQLYESFKQNLGDAIEALKSGDATLMREAMGVDLDISG
jgi:hypothetical protein